MLEEEGLRHPEKSGREDVNDWAKVLARRCGVGEKSVALARREGWS